MSFYVYIVANRRNGTIYIGMTDDLGKRVYEHKTKIHQGFTARYDCDKLLRGIRLINLKEDLADAY